MRFGPLVVVALLTAVIWAGCLSPNGPQGDAENAGDGGAAEGILAGSPLWPDPQNFPHPGWRWPTLSSPAVGADAPGWWAPIEGRPLPADVSAMEPVAQVNGLDKGAGIALFGRLAVVPESGAMTHIVDITDPTVPVVLSSFESAGRGAAIIAYPTGRLVTVLAGSAAIEVVDITDPLHPLQLPSIEVATHKLGVVPGTAILYNAANGGGGAPSQVGDDQATGSTAIFDLSDPENAERLPDFANGYGCHHIFFWNNETKQRAICAGFQVTQLWDTSDPRNPKVVVSIPFPHGMVGRPSGRVSVYSFSHTAGMNIAGDVLYAGDESNGGLPPGCALEVRMEDGSSYSTPMGATWFYDISDELNPLMKGWFSPFNDPRVNTPAPTDPDPLSNAVRSCTTHHGRIVPHDTRDLLAMSFYGDGVILLDFTDPASPRALDQFTDGTTNTWETWYYNGYLFTGDLSRGMDVLQLV